MSLASNKLVKLKNGGYKIVTTRTTAENETVTNQIVGMKETTTLQEAKDILTKKGVELHDIEMALSCMEETGDMVANFGFFNGFVSTSLN